MSFLDDDGSAGDDLCGAADAEGQPLKVVHQWMVRISARGDVGSTDYYTTAANPDDAIHSLLHKSYFPEVGDIVRRCVRMRCGGIGSAQGGRS